MLGSAVAILCGRCRGSSGLIHEDGTELAVRVLHTAYGPDAEDVAA